MAQTHLLASSALEHYYENYLGVGKTRAKRNETKRNGSHTHNNCKFLGASQRASDRCSSYISYPELIYILQYCQVRLYIVCFYCYDTWRGRESWLFSQPEAHTRPRPCFAGKLQPMGFILLLIHKVATT